MQRIVKGLIVLLIAVILIGGCGIAGFFASGMMFPARTATALNDGAPPEIQASMGVFWEAWNLVKAQFYQPDKLDPVQMTYGAVGGMVDSLGDPHTAFVEPSRAQRINQDLQGAFEGIGATVDMVNGRLQIVSPIKGSPAEKAGLKAGDIVVRVGNTVIQNMTTDDAVNLIRGPKGTQVTLTIQRVNTPQFDVQITRDQIQVPFVVSKMLDNNIGYVQMTEFGATAAQELHTHLLELQKNKPKAIIFDLRSNPGGFLDAAVSVVSEFIKPNQTMLIEEFKDGTRKEAKTTPGGSAYDIPVVLLVNGGSASASEIVSGALRDYKRATIIGTNTFGKGSVQTVNALSDQSQLRVTIAHFFSPKGLEINEVGVKPDIEVADPTDAERLQNKDPQLDRAIQFLLGGTFTAPADAGWVPASDAWLVPA